MRIIDGGDASSFPAAASGGDEPWHGHPELEPSFSSSISSNPWSGSHVRTSNHAKSRMIRGRSPAPNHEKFRRRLQAKKEILRRALAPPARRPTLRWLDFRPTPSRLGIMSAERSEQSSDSISSTQFLDASMMELRT